jgi:hypothetical protein
MHHDPQIHPDRLIEYGWAVKSLGYGRMVPVMNTAFGEPTAEDMPFDMRHLRNPLTYSCPTDLEDGGRRAVREQLSRDLESAIRAVLSSEDFKSSLPQPPAPPEFVEREPLQGHGRFRASGEPLGLKHYFGRPPSEVRLAEGPICWFRMIPTVEPGQRWSITELEKRTHSPIIYPVSRGWTGYDYVHGSDGYGIYSLLDDPNTAVAVVFAFTTGEIWSIDTSWLRPDGEKIVPAHAEKDIRQSLVDYGNFLDRLGIKAPYKWICGMEDLRGRHLYVPTPPGNVRIFQSHDGEGLVDEIMESGLYSLGEQPATTLKPFFTKLYESCGVSRQEWQDK